MLGVRSPSFPVHRFVHQLKAISNHKRARSSQCSTRKMENRMMKTEEPELEAEYACEVCEGPLWNPKEKKLNWCDIPRGRLFRFEPASG
jgi:hypothetical protein